MTTTNSNQWQLEQDILAGLLVQGSSTAPAGMANLRKEYFQHQIHQVIFQALCNLYFSNKLVDIVTVSEELARMGQLDIVGGRKYITDLSLSASTTVMAPVYVDLLIERYKGLRMQNLTQSLMDAYDQEATADELIVMCRDTLTEVGGLSKADAPKAVGELFESIDQHLLTVHELGGVPGTKSGYHGIDEKTNGFRAGQLVLVAGRPGSCKTTFALNLALNAAAIHKKRILIHSLEMSNDELIMRLAALAGQIRFTDIMQGRLSDDDRERLHTHCRELIESLPIFIADTPRTNVYNIKSQIDIAKRTGNPYDMVVIDYLQLMEMPHRKDDNQNLKVGEVSRELKLLAKEYEIPIIALSQLSRAVELRADKRPILSDLRDSGSLEQDADLVFMLYRDDYYYPDSPRQGELEVNLIKNRHGNSGITALLFDKGRCALRNR
jgi:replicative DNA helicase